MADLIEIPYETPMVPGEIRVARGEGWVLVTAAPQSGVGGKVAMRVFYTILSFVFLATPLYSFRGMSPTCLIFLVFLLMITAWQLGLAIQYLRRPRPTVIRAVRGSLIVEAGDGETTTYRADQIGDLVVGAPWPWSSPALILTPAAKYLTIFGTRFKAWEKTTRAVLLRSDRFGQLREIRAELLETMRDAIPS